MATKIENVKIQEYDYVDIFCTTGLIDVMKYDVGNIGGYVENGADLTQTFADCCIDVIVFGMLDNCF